MKASVVVERLGEASAPQHGLSPESVAEVLRDLDGARDVTMTVSPEGTSERLMVAIDGSRAFLGLERSDGLLQFVVGDDKQEATACLFTIGGQQSEIEGRYLPEIGTAAVVVKEWLQTGESSTLGHWERQ